MDAGRFRTIGGTGRSPETGPNSEREDVPERASWIVATVTKSCWSS